MHRLHHQFTRLAIPPVRTDRRRQPGRWTLDRPIRPGLRRHPVDICDRGRRGDPPRPRDPVLCVPGVLPSTDRHHRASFRTERRSSAADKRHAINGPRERHGSNGSLRHPCRSAAAQHPGGHLMRRMRSLLLSIGLAAALAGLVLAPVSASYPGQHNGRIAFGIRGADGSNIFTSSPTARARSSSPRAPGSTSARPSRPMAARSPTAPTRAAPGRSGRCARTGRSSAS